ncbi:MAG: hypothetical protein ACI9F9_001307 [Candidatus Paceibacteria bacterium]|jgi:hypothetical protein
MSAIQSSGETRIASIGSSVLKLQLDQAKQQGAAEASLIESAGNVRGQRPPASNGPGVGVHIDVQG